MKILHFTRIKIVFIIIIILVFTIVTWLRISIHFLQSYREIVSFTPNVSEQLNYNKVEHVPRSKRGKHTSSGQRFNFLDESNELSNLTSVHNLVTRQRAISISRSRLKFIVVRACVADAASSITASGRDDHDLTVANWITVDSGAH